MKENETNFTHFIDYNTQLAHQFIEAIKKIASKEQNLNNFECYLSQHFETWLKKYASTPEGITAELKSFANMEI